MRAGKLVQPSIRLRLVILVRYWWFLARMHVRRLVPRSAALLRRMLIASARTVRTINYLVPANTTSLFFSLKADIQSRCRWGIQHGYGRFWFQRDQATFQGVISSPEQGWFGFSSRGSALSHLQILQFDGEQNKCFWLTQNISAGVSDQEIGSYTFQAAAAEGVNVNNVSIGANGLTNGNGSPFQNLHVMVNGSQFGSTQGTVASGSIYTFSGTPFNVPVGGSVSVNVYADTLSSALGGVTTATTLTGCSATGQVSYSSISCNSTAGQNITFGGNPAITVAAVLANLRLDRS